MAALLERASTKALLIVDSSGTIHWANSHARKISTRWGLFELGSPSEARITNARLQRLLQENHATSDEPVRHYFTADAHFLELTTLHNKATSENRELFALEIDCYQLEGYGEETLAQLCPSEFRLIRALEQTRSLKETARVLNISYENARTKLKHIFQKLDVHSQRQLLAKVHHAREHADFNAEQGATTNYVPV